MMTQMQRSAVCSRRSSCIVLATNAGSPPPGRPAAPPIIVGIIGPMHSPGLALVLITTVDHHAQFFQLILTSWGSHFLQLAEVTPLSSSATLRTAVPPKTTLRGEQPLCLLPFQSSFGQILDIAHKFGVPYASYLADIPRRSCVASCNSC